jgi:hypothetical protein
MGLDTASKMILEEFWVKLRLLSLFDNINQSQGGSDVQEN